MAAEGKSEAPAVHRERVDAAWVDYNGHMNVAYYVMVFDHATDAVLDNLGLGAPYREKTGCSVFVGEMHVCYLQEVLAGDDLMVTTRLLASDAKRLVMSHQMVCRRLPEAVASNEVLCVHVDLAARRSVPWPHAVGSALAEATARDAGSLPACHSGQANTLPPRMGGIHRTLTGRG